MEFATAPLMKPRRMLKAVVERTLGGACFGEAAMTRKLRAHVCLVSTTAIRVLVCEQVGGYVCAVLTTVIQALMQAALAWFGEAGAPRKFRERVCPVSTTAIRVLAREQVGGYVCAVLTTVIQALMQAALAWFGEAAATRKSRERVCAVSTTAIRVLVQERGGGVRHRLAAVVGCGMFGARLQ